VSIATVARHHVSPGPSRQQRRGLRREQRRQLRRLDRLGARLAELHAIGALLEDAADLVSSGWVQGAWFTVGEG
jgi:hypothetical protein